MTDSVKHSGQVFTPDYLVKNILDEAGYFGPVILKKHCIDNSCGDGAFICEFLRRYIEAYKQSYGTIDDIAGDIKKYIHGIEIDPVAYACCLENVTAVLDEYGLTDCEPDLLLGDTLNNRDFVNKMDYVIGNPPYVRVHNLEGHFNAVKSYSFASAGMTDLYLVFFEIGFRMLKNGGKLCYITPSSWINSVAGAALRFYIMTHRNLLSIIDLEHYQAFPATTYTMISLFEKGRRNDSFAYHIYNAENLQKKHVCDINFNDVEINGYFYFADNNTLESLRKILTTPCKKYTIVKNGFATLADKVFISSSFPFTEYTIPTIKASTGKWYKAFFPYDENGKPLSKEVVFSNHEIAAYLVSNKDALLKDSTEEKTPDWYLYGRTQALKDVYLPKISINTTIKDINSLKINFVDKGCGLYSGLYILTDISYDVIKELLERDDFINYIASLKKYKSGGYYTFNSKDLELYLNFNISQRIKNGSLTVKNNDEHRLFESGLSLFQGIS